MSNRVGSFIELGMEKEMSKWSRKVKRVLSAVGISVLIAVNAASFSMNASAATIIADSVMIRDDASTDAGIIGSLNEGDEVTIVDQVTDGEGYIWYYVQLENGNYGYVRSDRPRRKLPNRLRKRRMPSRQMRRNRKPARLLRRILQRRQMRLFLRRKRKTALLTR